MGELTNQEKMDMAKKIAMSMQTFLMKEKGLEPGETTQIIVTAAAMCLGTAIKLSDMPPAVAEKLITYFGDITRKWMSAEECDHAECAHEAEV